MSTAEYSGTPLIRKLGIGEKMKVLLVNPPDNYFELIDQNIKKQLAKKKMYRI